MNDTLQLWIIIVGLGIGSFAMRFLFLGLVGDRAMPAWVLRHLRYTAVSIIPALVAPLVLWPNTNGGDPDPTRLAAAFVCFAVAYIWKNVALAVLAGAGTLYGLIWLL